MSTPQSIGPPDISIVVPTYREAENIPVLARELQDVMSGAGRSYEVIFVDDDSQDGSEELARQLSAELPLRIVVRKNERGLSTAVLDGIDVAAGRFVVVMDADLSHPPSAIPEMVRLLESGEADFVVGSRYVTGGSIHEGWGLFRAINSRLPCLLARPLAPLRDPMSGFFALRREDVPPRSSLSPLGYKIGLELFVKGSFARPKETPIHFAARRHGESKLSLREQLNFLRHLRRLYQHRHPVLAELLQFGMVGASGFVVDLAVYFGAQALLGVDHRLARALSFLVAASWNWAVNRAITFDLRPKTPKLRQWPAFVLTSVVGFLVNWGCYAALTTFVPFFDAYRLGALVLGVAAGMGFNFAAARTFVFKPAAAAADEHRRDGE